MRILIVIGFILAELTQIGVWFAAAFHEVDYQAALPYWSLLGLGIFVVPIGFFACFSRQLRMATACAGVLAVGAVAAIIAAHAVGAPPAPFAELYEIVAPFLPALILLGCIRGMASPARPGPSGDVPRVHTSTR